jgi:hypothetical protein
MLHKITKILSVASDSVICEFDHIEIRKIDLSDWIKEFKKLDNNWTSRLADPVFFASVKLADYGTLLWDNDIDFDPDVLYMRSTPSMSVVSA